MRRIQVFLPSQEAAMVRRMPILAGVDAAPPQFQQTIDVRHHRERARHRQFIGAQLGESPLHVDHKQGAVCKVDRFHESTPADASTL
jgi:hypothetical protein